MSATEVLEDQAKLIEQLVTLCTNTKKDGDDRKTAEYLKDRLDAANNLWSAITANHKKLEPVKSQLKDQPYYTEKSLDKGKGAYAELSMIINAKMHELKVDVQNEKDAEKKERRVNIKRAWSTAHSELTDMLTTIDGEIDNEGKTTGIFRTELESVRSAWNEARPKYLLAQEVAGDQEKNKNRKSYDELFKIFITVSGSLQDKISDTVVQNEPDKKKSVELPKIKIPDFDGKLSTWHNFHELFTQIIHKNKSIDNASKMHYLKTVVKGEAARLIAHLQPTATNYVAAYDILVKRYSNTRIQLGKLLDSITNLPQLTGETCAGLKNLHDTVYECIQGIGNLDVNTDGWDALLTYLLIKKLDKETRKHYECQLKDPRTPPTVKDFLSYIESRFMALEAYEPKVSESVNKNNFNDKNNKQSEIKKEKKEVQCFLCEKQHKIADCDKFKSMNEKERHEVAKQRGLCTKCLGGNHRQSTCRSSYKCKICNRGHNTLLHMKDFVPQKQPEQHNNKKPTEYHNSPSTSKTLNTTASNCMNTILATAMVKAKTANGEHMLLKALIDQGSQSTFITEHAAQLLAISREKIMATITGIGEQAKQAKSTIHIQLTPRMSSNFVLFTNALVLDKITNSPNLEDIDDSKWHHLHNLTLADPNYKNNDRIDILLGAGDYGKIIRGGLLKGNENTPIAQNTEFGWIISGQSVDDKNDSEVKIMSMVSTAEIDAKVKMFWEINEIPDDALITEEEEACESHYKNTHARLSNGRYVVKIPFKNSEFADIGESRNMAIATFLQMERKFQKQPEFFADYKKFIDEYISLGHMTLADDNCTNQVNYLPHHAVLKESTTTKLRVVFDASRKTTNQKSLNDSMAIGPLLQTDMISLITKWRKHAIAFTADIEKMYRQILVHESQTNLQRIIWRNSPKEKLQEYKLLTITYGTANAPYLAIRTLQQCADDEAENFPLAKSVIKNDFYVDDLISGAECLEDAVRIKNEVIGALSSAGFHLRKWTSNCENFMKTIPDADREVDISQEIYIDDTAKTLGIHWQPKEDVFMFKINIKENDTRTKRMLLSEVASLFDPLGWLAPIVIKAKALLQELWTLGSGWDDELPEHIHSQWTKIKSELPTLRELRIPRWIFTQKSASIEIHGFCDASELAYAAVIYVKATCIDQVNISLLSAKTKVAPIKKMTIPRLELCGAFLLARLMKQVTEALQLNCSSIHMWTDSKIALAWIKGNPKRWKTFIANKCISINSMSNKNDWNHVSSGDNPADVASRGIYPKDIHNFSLWWNGPSWLQADKANYPREMEYDTAMEEKTTAIVLNVTVNTDILPDVSSYFKLQKVVAFCSRFIHNCKNSKQKIVGPISIKELRAASINIIKIIQKDSYAREIEVLNNKGQLEKCNKLLKLNPFTDTNNILRVGGRLENAKMNYDAKHQILLPRKHNVTRLIIKMAHQHTLHGGPKLTEAVLRQRYWIPNGYNVIKSILHECTTCRRYGQRTMTQQMASLPLDRVDSLQAFETCGIDYAGPIQVRTWKGRGHKSYKAYIAVFVCMATKAIDLECVSDMTADAFIAALRRFVSKRGIPTKIFSDNGSNFVKANKLLQLSSQEEEAEYNEKIYNELQKANIEWHFIPPGAPNFGGLWEAAVKSMKTHLKKVIGDSTLTYEELTTLLYQIEASLNSRPLCPLSNDPNDISSLTPGHFLVGRPLLSLPEGNVMDINTNRLSRWQMIQKMHQQFWRKWHTEYLNRLQERPKWMQKREDPEINDLVLIKDENLPPSRWAMARIIDKHPGSDNLTRVVTLKTSNNILKRPITKICPLISNSVPRGSTTEAVTHVSKISLPIVLLMLTTLFVHTQTAPLEKITLQPFTHTPGIFFENRGQAYLTNTNWNIITFYDLKLYLDEINSMKKCVKTILDICETTNVRPMQCRETAQNLQQHLEEIEDKNEIIWPTNRRRKRATLNFVGNILNDVFGVLDSRFAEQYTADISKIKTNEEHVMQLLRNHTSIEETTTNIIRRDEKMIQRNYELIEGLVSGIHMLKSNDEANTQLMLSALELLHAMVKYESTQSAILDALLSAHGNRLDPKIITPHQLKSQLQKIKEHVGDSFKVPEDYTHNSMRTVYQIMSVRAMVNNDKIIFKLTLPLLHNEQFQIFKLIPVPTKANDSFVLMQPSIDFLLATRNRNYFFTMVDREFNNCIMYSDDQYICKRNKPLLTTATHLHECEINMLEHKQLAKTCKIQTNAMENTWIPLHQANRWIYVLYNEYDVDLICGDEIEHIKIQGEGILTIRRDCVLKHETLELNGQSNYQHEIKGSILPQLNLTVELVKNQYRAEETIPHHIQTKFDIIDEMIKADRSNEAQLPEDLDAHDIHQYSLGYTTLIIIFLFFVYFYFKQAKPMKRIREQLPFFQRIELPQRAISMPNLPGENE